MPRFLNELKPKTPSVAEILAESAGKATYDAFNESMRPWAGGRVIPRWEEQSDTVRAAFRAGALAARAIVEEK